MDNQTSNCLPAPTSLPVGNANGVLHNTCGTAGNTLDVVRQIQQNKYFKQLQKINPAISVSMFVVLEQFIEQQSPGSTKSTQFWEAFLQQVTLQCPATPPGQQREQRPVRAVQGQSVKTPILSASGTIPVVSVAPVQPGATATAPLPAPPLLPLACKPEPNDTVPHSTAAPEPKNNVDANSCQEAVAPAANDREKAILQDVCNSVLARATPVSMSSDLRKDNNLDEAEMKLLDSELHVNDSSVKTKDLSDFLGDSEAIDGAYHELPTTDTQTHEGFDVVDNKAVALDPNATEVKQLEELFKPLIIKQQQHASHVVPRRAPVQTDSGSTELGHAGSSRRSSGSYGSDLLVPPGQQHDWEIVTPTYESQLLPFDDLAVELGLEPCSLAGENKENGSKDKATIKTRRPRIKKRLPGPEADSKPASPPANVVELRQMVNQLLVKQTACKQPRTPGKKPATSPVDCTIVSHKVVPQHTKRTPKVGIDGKAARLPTLDQCTAELDAHTAEPTAVSPGRPRQKALKLISGCGRSAGTGHDQLQPTTKAECHSPSKRRQAVALKTEQRDVVVATASPITGLIVNADVQAANVTPHADMQEADVTPHVTPHARSAANTDSEATVSVNLTDLRDSASSYQEIALRRYCMAQKKQHLLAQVVDSLMCTPQSGPTAKDATQPTDYNNHMAVDPNPEGMDATQDVQGDNALTAPLTNGARAAKNDHANKQTSPSNHGLKRVRSEDSMNGNTAKHEARGLRHKKVKASEPPSSIMPSPHDGTPEQPGAAQVPGNDTNPMNTLHASSEQVRMPAHPLVAAEKVEQHTIAGSKHAVVEQLKESSQQVKVQKVMPAFLKDDTDMEGRLTTKGKFNVRTCLIRMLMYVGASDACQQEMYTRFNAPDLNELLQSYRSFRSDVELLSAAGEGQVSGLLAKHFAVKV